jgi:hypothetical protein
LWLNTTCETDIAYCKHLQKQFSWIKTFDLTVPYAGNGSINSFFKLASDPNTIYIRLDDDIVYIEPTFIKKLVNKRKQDLLSPLIYPLIINNGNINSLMQQRNKLWANTPITIALNAQNELFYDPKLTEKLHLDFIKDVKQNNVSKYYIPDTSFTNFYRVSINCISWYGELIGKILPIHGDEEQFLSVTLPKQLQIPNALFGEAICAHFAFVTQREFLDKTNVLNEYKLIASSLNEN